MSEKAKLQFEQMRDASFTPVADILTFYDSLPAVTLDEMWGVWSGGEVLSGHPADGLLVKSGWVGKQFDDPETVHPLQMTDGHGGRWMMEPTKAMAAGGSSEPPAFVKSLPLDWILWLAKPFVSTTKPAARLRMTEYRGVVTATMLYDCLPINDVFRKVDDGLVLGVMDQKGGKKDHPYVFWLRRNA